MDIPPFVIYLGRKYWLQKTGRYYSDGLHGKIKKERLLHRVIWRDHFGDISKGMCVHHRDGNWQNNDISNLELVEKRQHSRQHLLNTFKNPLVRARMMAGLEKARVAAVNWHGSKRGLEWHSRHGIETWENRKKVEHKCAECGKEFMSYWPTIQKFCSVSCREKTRRRKLRKEIKCACCGIRFDAYKYSKSKTCSPKCTQAKRASDKVLICD